METRFAPSKRSAPDLSPVHKRSLSLAGNKTSVSLEDQFWDGLNEIAASKGVSTATLVAKIDTNRTNHNLSSAIRLFVLDHFRNGQL